LTEVDEIAMKALDPVFCDKLLAAELPWPIQTERQFDRMVARLEELDFAKRELTPEEKALRESLAALIEVYDEEHHHIPGQPPHEMVRHLMEQRGLKQTDLVPVLGSRAQVSDLVSGKRGISKAQVKALAEYFAVSPELFF
jgi:HTH-type transcriptional regulator/antitoxin HigA